MTSKVGSLGRNFLDGTGVSDSLSIADRTGYSLIRLSGTSHYIKLENVLKAQLSAADFIL
jgi:hypothetical protein